VNGRPDPSFDFVCSGTIEFSADRRHPGYLALKGPKLHVMVNVKGLQKLGILNQGNKMLKEFLRQAENNDMAPIKEGSQRPHPFSYEDIITFSPEKCLGFDPRIVAEMIRELIDRPNEMARRTNIYSGNERTAQKVFGYYASAIDKKL